MFAAAPAPDHPRLETVQCDIGNSSRWSSSSPRDGFRPRRRLASRSSRSAKNMPAFSIGCRQIHNTNWRSEEHTSELQSLMRISYAVFCLKKKSKHTRINSTAQQQKPNL